MPSRPRVSVGLPVYNGEEYLEQAVISLLAQTFTDLELIICDNASTDRTEEICRKYVALDSRVHYHRSPENAGAARNHNLSFELSTGEFFRWAAYDDLCAPEHLERCVAELDANPSVVLCYPRTKVIDADGKVVGSHDDGLALLSADPVERYVAYQERFRDITWCEPVFGLIRREVMAKTRLLGNYNSADVILLGELALLGAIHEVPEYLFFRRIHPSISTRANPTPEELAEWFDPKARGRIVAPLWRLVYEQFRAIQAVSMTHRNKARCYAHATKWLAWWAPSLAQEGSTVVKMKLSRALSSSDPGA